MDARDRRRASRDRLFLFNPSRRNDHGANPRHTAVSHNHHAGSREKLYHLRKTNARETCQARLEKAESMKEQFSKRRISLITNWSIENS